MQRRLTLLPKHHTIQY